MQATTGYALIPKRRMLSDEYALYVNIPAAGLRTEHYRNLSITTAKIDDLAVTTAKITNLAVTDAKIDTLTVTKLTTGNLTAIGTITTGSLVTGAAGTNRIEITSSTISGINSLNVTQFYLSATDGKAYFGADNCMLDASGITIKGQFAIFQNSSGTTNGYIYCSPTPTTYFYISGWNTNLVLTTNPDYAVVIQPGGTGWLSVTCKILPNSTGYDLGGASAPWSTVYADNYIVNTKIAPDATGGADLGTTSLYFNNAYINYATISAILQPDTTGGADIGTSSLYFNNAYISNLVTDTSTGMKIGTATNQKIGFWNHATTTQPSAYTQTYATADKTLSAYTSDPESSDYTAIDNTWGSAIYAQCADLNILRVAYENLRVLAEDTAQMLNSVVDDLQAMGLVG